VLDENGRLVSDAALVLEEGRVRAVGTPGEMPAARDAEMQEHGAATIRPVHRNAHAGTWRGRADGRSDALMWRSRKRLRLRSRRHAISTCVRGGKTMRDLGALRGRRR